MTDPLPPPFVFVVCFDGGPVSAFADDEEARDFLADVFEADAKLYQVWTGSVSGAMLQNRTAAFVEDWAKCFDFGHGDDREAILRPFPEFIRSFLGDKMVEEYRKAQEAA